MWEEQEAKARPVFDADRVLSALAVTTTTKMFSKIPKQLTSTFGILGDDAKLAFRSSATGVQKLANTRVSVAATAQHAPI